MAVVVSPAKGVAKRPSEEEFNTALLALSPAGKDSGWCVHFWRDVRISFGCIDAGAEYAVLGKKTGKIFAVAVCQFTGTKAKALRAQKTYWDLVQRLGQLPTP